MTQKIVQTLQKFSPQSRCVWGALLIVAAVHLLLAVLFKHTPQASQENISELPRVGRIVLSDKSNENLVKWMKNHDPAVMTAVDPVLGYSQVMAKSYQRSEPEDLPNLLQPVMPQKSVAVHQTGRLEILSEKLLPESTPVMLLHDKQTKAETAGFLAVINGEYSAAISKKAAELLAGYDLKKLQELQKNSNTELEIVPGRLEDTGARVVLKKSSGSLLLDEKASEIIHKSMLANTGNAEYYGIVEFIWRNAAAAEPFIKEQKL